MTAEFILVSVIILGIAAIVDGIRYRKFCKKKREIDDELFQIVCNKEIWCKELQEERINLLRSDYDQNKKDEKLLHLQLLNNTKGYYNRCCNFLQYVIDNPLLEKQQIAYLKEIREAYEEYSYPEKKSC